MGVSEGAGASPLALDPTRPMIVSAWGRKGSGKSVFNRRLYQSYPFDKVAIDVNGNAEPGADAERLTDLPDAFPVAPAKQGRRQHRNLHYRADPGSDTYTDDLDRGVGLALFPQDRPTAVWAGEVGEFMPSASKINPHMRRLLMQNRHYRATAFFDGPRPVNVSPLILAQSDLVAVFQLPNPDDRERIAKTIGFPADKFHAECHETWRRGPHWFLLWVTAENQLYRMAPLPVDD